jgi:predicted PurR-regulated permease PerM
VADGDRPSKPIANTTLLNVVIVIAVLYFARAVFIPLALAVLLAFLLGPLVIRLRHWGLGRVPATMVVVLFSCSVIAVIGTGMTSQLADFAHKMPEYQHNVREKLHELRTSGGGLINRVSRIVRNVTEELTPTAPPTPGARPGEEKPVPVEIHKTPFSPLDLVPLVLGSALNTVVMAGIVVVFVIFILIQREDLRDRVIKLAGAGRVNLTTKVLDDAAQRVSRFLLAQLIVNACYGVLVGIGLYFTGVPNPLLWATLAALLRYIPYLGIWIAAAMPAAVAVAVDPGWLKLWFVFGIYIGVDLLIYNFVEPLLYGSSTGISPIAILVATVFWTWLWGPLGLLLATPLTVCLVVIGRHVPRLSFLSVMLSDEPVLGPETRLYQRLLAIDLEEATDVAEEFLKEGKSLEEFFDVVVIPALSLAEEDRHRGKLDEAKEHALFQNALLLIDDIAERAEDLAAGNGSKRRADLKSNGKQHRHQVSEEFSVACIPARDEADEIASRMLVELLNRRGVAARAFGASALAGECLETVSQAGAKVVCVLSVPPFGYMHARYLCRRLQGQLPECKVVAAILTEREADEIKKREPQLPADELVTSLREALTAVLSLAATKTSEPQTAVQA